MSDQTHQTNRAMSVLTKALVESELLLTTPALDRILFRERPSRAQYLLECTTYNAFLHFSQNVLPLDSAQPFLNIGPLMPKVLDHIVDIFPLSRFRRVKVCDKGL